jgi:hypothetical protein
VTAAGLLIDSEARAAPRPGPAPLRPDQLQWGRIAWQYFERNLHPETGLPGSVDKFFSATAWEIGSYLNALVSARAIGILDPGRFDRLAGSALGAIGRLPLYEGALPNKSYDVRTLAMTDYNGQPSQTGIGWSGLDTARLLIALNILARRHPEHQGAVQDIVGRWRLDRLIADGVIMGKSTDVPGEHQEGRLGYEEYAAKGLVLVGPRRLPGPRDRGHRPLRRGLRRPGPDRQARPGEPRRRRLHHERALPARGPGARPGRPLARLRLGGAPGPGAAGGGLRHPHRGERGPRRGAALLRLRLRRRQRRAVGRAVAERRALSTSSASSTPRPCSAGTPCSRRPTRTA